MAGSREWNWIACRCHRTTEPGQGGGTHRRKLVDAGPKLPSSPHSVVGFKSALPIRQRCSNVDRLQLLPPLVVRPRHNTEALVRVPGARWVVSCSAAGCRLLPAMAQSGPPSGSPLFSAALPNNQRVDGLVTETADQTPTTAQLQRASKPHHGSVAAHANHWRRYHRPLSSQREAVASTQRPLA